MSAVAIQQVGALTGGVAAARWSPDGEVLSMVSGDGQLLLMNKVSLGNAIEMPLSLWHHTFSCVALAIVS